MRWIRRRARDEAPADAKWNWRLAETRRLDGTPRLDELASELEAVRATELRRRDVELRTRWNPTERRGGFRVRAEDVPRLVREARAPSLTAALLSTHTDGHVREAATEVLATIADPDVGYPFLLIRCADWVENVRELAVVAVTRASATVSERTLLECAVLFERLSEPGSRGWNDAARIRRLALRRVGDNALFDGLRDPDLHLRHAFARAIVERGRATEALDPALEQSDLVTALIIGRAALASKDDSERQRHLEAMLGSRYTALAGEAAWSLVREPANDPRLVQRLLTDARRPVRSVAQRAASERGIDVADFYRSRITSSVAAIAGIGEYGTSGDTALVVPYLTDADAQVRSSAIGALGRLDPDPFTEVFLAALADPSASVARAAGHALAGRGHDERVVTSVTAILTDDSSERSESARRAARSIVRTFPRWARLRVALACLGAGNQETCEFGRNLVDGVLAGWNRSFAMPTSSDRDELSHRVRDAGGLRGDQRTELVALLKVYGVNVPPE